LFWHYLGIGLGVLGYLILIGAVAALVVRELEGVEAGKNWRVDHHLKGRKKMEGKEGTETGTGEDLVEVAGVKMLEGLLPALERHMAMSEENAKSMARIAAAFESIAENFDKVARVAALCEMHYRDEAEHRPWRSV
jgi:hypothetical protein